ncbi:peptide chain release factor aRF-1 [Candidatus Woesearchaeota archaeon]|nr:peptide chain release factor aRF-1 [Candidatus Woesearchaeota archaeon]
MSLTAKQKYDLKKVVNELDSHKAMHTELISVYIPTGYDMNKIISHLSQEQGTASNIKSASTRKNVISALERMIQHLRLFRQTPENGLAVFSGNVARQGQIDLRVWSVEPPIPLQTRIYRCDKNFQLDLLRDMLETKEMYGLIVMDRREGIIASLRGKAITTLAKYTSDVPGKSKAGGQSAQRFERLREGAAKQFYTRLADHAKDQFFGKPELKGLIVGGPGPTKNDFVEGSFLPTELKKKIIAIKDVTYTDEFGLHELVDKSQDVLAQEEIASEKKIMAKFFELLSTKQGMVSYGQSEVMKMVKDGVVDTLLLSEDLEEKAIAEFEEEAKKYGTKVEIISTETREGAQLRDFGMVAAILRYEMHQG